MFRIDWKKLRGYALVMTLAVTATVALMPAKPVVAQARALPDFTDLVEQVGPAVVNIRTLERARAVGQQLDGSTCARDRLPARRAVQGRPQQGGA